MKSSLTVFAFAVSTAVSMQAQQVPALRALTEPWPEIVKVDGIEIVHVQKNIYMLVGGGANVTAQIGDQGVMLVDSGGIGQGEKIVAAVRSLSKKPFRYLVNTGADPELAGGDDAVAKAGGGRVGGEVVIGPGQTGQTVARLGILSIAHENSFNRLVAGSPAFPALTGEGLPGSSFFTPRKDIFSNGEPVEILYQPNAHTDGDVVVFFRGSDVVSAGEVFRTDSYPDLDLARGGSIEGELQALNNILDITVPERNQMGGTRVVPAHGRICNESDVLEYRDMLAIVRDRIRSMIAKNMSLQQVKAAQPTLEYDGLYGQKEISGDKFIEVVYNDLSKKPKK
jgi:glyoxylase-like metal-dependent hydrolase (beta-lactamase superfamily II)